MERVGGEREASECCACRRRASAGGWCGCWKMSRVAQFSLRWNEYAGHMSSAFRALRAQHELADVTLSCAGGKLRAHRLLLSACSGYLRDVFRDNPCRHPVVIFRNVDYDDLVAIVDFMYYGEVNIAQERLESFLMTAELLEVKGLTDGSDEEERARPADAASASPGASYADPTATKKAAYENTDIALAPYEEPINLATTQIQHAYQPLASTSRTAEATEPTDYDNASRDDHNSNMDNQFTQNEPSLHISGTQSSAEEMQIDNQSLDNNVSIEDLSDKNNGNETDLAKFRCQLCPKGFKHPTSLTLHKDSHTGKTQCPVCHRSFSRSYDMRSHLQKIHQGKQLTIKEIRYKVSNETAAPKTYTHHI